MLSEDQKAQLTAPLSMAHVKKNQRGFDYVESWHAEAEANRIFGFDGWSSIVLETKCVMERERKLSSGDGWGVTYTAIVRITAGGQTRDGAGAGHGMDKDLGLAHESAIKEAASDAEKRAFKTFGNPFGLALYDKKRENVVSGLGGRDPPNAHPNTSADMQGPPSGLKRLSAAQAKERGMGDTIKDEIDTCKSEEDLDDWEAEFDRHTAQVPMAWLDAIRNHTILRREEIQAEIKGAEMDKAFRETVG